MEEIPGTNLDLKDPHRLDEYDGHLGSELLGPALLDTLPFILYQCPIASLKDRLTSHRCQS